MERQTGEFKIKRIRTPKENHQPAAIHSETLRKRRQEPKRRSFCLLYSICVCSNMHYLQAKDPEDDKP